MLVQCIVYCVQCTPSPLQLKSVPGWPAISVSTWQESRIGQTVWFGCLSAISQLASREGEGGGVRQLCLHSVTQPFTTWPRWRVQGGGLCSLPLPPPPHLKTLQNTPCYSILQILPTTWSIHLQLSKCAQVIHVVTKLHVFLPRPNCEHSPKKIKQILSCENAWITCH